MNHPTHTDLFSRPHHICIVVDDLEASVAYYESLGVGPWHEFFGSDDFVDLSIPRAAFETLKYKLCRLGNIQLQICEPGSGDTPQRAFLEDNGPGVYHVGFTVPNVDEAESHATQHLGLARGVKGRRADDSGYTYFDTRAPAGVILEIRSLPDVPEGTHDPEVSE